MEKGINQSLRKRGSTSSSFTNLQGHRSICRISQNVKKPDPGSANSKAESPKAEDGTILTDATILNSGKEPESSCYLEMQYAFYVKGLERSRHQLLQTTLSPCECGIERTTDFTTSKQYGGYVPPVTPAYQAVKHTEKYDKAILCPICGGRIERGRSYLEVRSESR